MYHPIKFGCKFTAILNLCCDTDLECSKPIFHRTLRLYYQIKFECKPTSSLEDTIEIVILSLWLYKPSLQPWHWTKWTNFFCMTLWFMIMYYQTKFGSKRISSSKNTVDIVIFWSHELLPWSWPWKWHIKSFCMTLTHNDASQYQVGKQNVWWFRRYHLDKH